MITRRSTLAVAASCAALAISGLAEPAVAQADKPLTIMTSLPNMAFPFFVHMQKELRAEAEALGNITLMESDGQGSTPKQTADVETAIVQGVDGIIISPNEVDAMAPALQQAVDAGIPVVTIDRRVDNVPGMLAHVGADNVKGGEAQGRADHGAVPGRRQRFQSPGPARLEPGDRPQCRRPQRARSACRQVSLRVRADRQFARDKGLSVTEAGLAGLAEPPDVIVAANDDMALGAIEAVKAAG